MHCLQIIREALSNVVKHAEAEHCWLRLTQDGIGTINVEIEDDGIGIRPEEQRTGHYGLIILRERANSLNGSISIGLRPGGGTGYTCASARLSPHSPDTGACHA